MDKIDDFIYIIAMGIACVMALPVLAAMILPIPFVIYKVVATIISVINDAVNGRLSKDLDGSPLDDVAYERYKEFKMFVNLILSSILFVPVMFVILAFGPIIILGVICLLPFYIIIRNYLKKK